MDRKTLDEKIEKRVVEMANKDIAEFQYTVGDAVGKLCKAAGSYYVKNGSFIRDDECGKLTRRILGQILSETPNKGWPHQIWDQRRDELTSQILSSMSAMERMLVAKDVDPEKVCTPDE